MTQVYPLHNNEYEAKRGDTPIFNVTHPKKSVNRLFCHFSLCKIHFLKKWGTINTLTRAVQQPSRDWKSAQYLLG